MVKLSTIFSGCGISKTTDIMSLLMALVSDDTSLQEKKEIWNLWQTTYYDKDALKEFFSDSLFSDGGVSYLNIVCQNNYKDFYEMALALDMANFDSRAYYLYWILGYGHPIETELVKNAFEYDPDTIKGIFPYIEDILGV